MSLKYALDPNNVSQSQQNSARFNTIKIAQVYTENREQAIKLDPIVFVQHYQEYDNKRDSEIEVSVLEQRKRYAQKHEGSPIRYL